MSKFWSYVFILGNVIITQMCLDLYTPSMPAMQQSLHTSNAAVQLTITVYLAGIFFSAFFFGSLSDCYGRRRMLLISYSGFFIASIATLFSQNIETLLFARVLQGISLGLCLGCGKGIMRDLYSGKSMATIVSYSSMLKSTTIIISPAVGGYVQEHLGWHTNFAIILAAGLFMLFATIAKCKETNTVTRAFKLKSTLHSYKDILKHRIFIGSVLCLVCSYSITTLIIQMGPFLFQNLLHFTPSQYGFIPLGLGLLGILGAQINIALLKKAKGNTLILSAFCNVLIISVLAASIGMLGWRGFWFTIIPLLFIRAVGPWIYANSVANTLQHFGKLAGTAGSAMSAIVYLGGASISLLAAHITQHSQIELFICTTTLSTVGLISFLRLVFKRHSHEVATI